MKSTRPESVLELLHLGKLQQGTFVPNIACYLLFANDPTERFNGCRIRFLRFEGEQEGAGDRFNAIKDRYIHGPVPQIIAETATFLGGQLREFSRLGPDGKFTTAKEYPVPVWYEAIVNACIHRSYGLRNMDVFVKMFDDRLVIERPWWVSTARDAGQHLRDASSSEPQTDEGDEVSRLCQVCS